MTVGKNADIVTGIGLAALGTYVYLESAAMPVVRRGLGPGGYPKFISIGLIALGLILVVQSFLRRSGGDKPLFTITFGAIGRILFFLALSFIYIWAIRPLGFIVASIPYGIIGAYFFGYRRLLINVAVSVALPVTVFLIFRYVFLVLIPTGTIW